MNTRSKVAGLFCCKLLLLSIVSSHSAMAQVTASNADIAQSEQVQANQVLFSETEKSAKAGDAASQYRLSRMYRDGRGVEKNEREATYWLQHAAEKGNPSAQFDVATELVEQRDYIAALRLFLPLAQAGNPLAQEWVGTLYHQGWGVQVDYAQTLHWASAAAAQNVARAMTNIGYLYEHGEGVPLDYAQAADWYRKAADLGDDEAQFDLGTLYNHGQGVPQDFPESMNWFRAAAEQGHAKAEYALGVLLIGGRVGQKDVAAGLNLLQQAAKQNEPDAVSFLAGAYLSGTFKELPMDRALGRAMLVPLAEQGELSAQRMLGIDEAGVRNYVAAAEWLKKAADQGDFYSTVVLAQLYRDGAGVPQDFEKAGALFVRATTLKGSAEVMNQAAWFFATAKDPKFRNPELALKYGLLAVKLSEGTNAAMLDTLAQAYSLNHDYTQAVNIELRALSLQPARADFRKSLARFQSLENQLPTRK